MEVIFNDIRDSESESQGGRRRRQRLLDGSTTYLEDRSFIIELNIEVIEKTHLISKEYSMLYAVGTGSLVLVIVYI